MSKPALALLLVLALAGCAPDVVPATQRVEVEGTITAVTASAGERDYVLEVAGQGLLPLELPGARPPMGARGVVVEVPDSLEVPVDPEGEFAALDGLFQQSGEALGVVDFLR